jgi:hypothetical protein
VAVARKLSVLLHRLWVSGEVSTIHSTTRIGAKSERRQLRQSGDGADKRIGGAGYWHKGDPKGVDSHGSYPIALQI